MVDDAKKNPYEPVKFNEPVNPPAVPASASGKAVDPATTAKAPFYLLGRKLGVYDSVDIMPETGILVYGFEPDALCKLPAGDVMLDLGRGKGFREAGPTGAATGEVDLIDAVKDCVAFTQEEWNANETRLAQEDADEEGDPDFDLPGDK